MEDATLIKRINNLFILRAQANGAEYPLRGEMLVGREVECAIPLDSGHVSRYHAKINVSPSGVYIEDLHSTNGTYVNGKKIRGRVKLTLGDEVGFDDLYFRLTSDASGSEGDTALAPQKYENPEDDRTRQMPAPVRPTPIRPTLVPDSNSVKVADNARIDDKKPLSKSSYFPNADDIDLDKPIDSRHALAEEPDYQQHLQQRFQELDALMDEGNAKSVDSSELPANAAKQTPVKSQPTKTVNAFVKNDASNVKITPTASEQGNRTKAAPSQPDKIPMPAPAEPAMDVQEEERTQMISLAQMDHLIERNRQDLDLIIGSGPRLIVTTAPLRGKLISLQDFNSGTSVQIGRDPNAAIFLNDKTISTDHARLSKNADGYFLSATHAKNGIAVNGSAVKRSQLAHNDRIQIGRTELLFKTDVGTQETPRPESLDPVVKGHGRNYGILVTVILLVVLFGAIIATSH